MWSRRECYSKNLYNLSLTPDFRLIQRVRSASCRVAIPQLFLKLPSNSDFDNQCEKPRIYQKRIFLQNVNRTMNKKVMGV